MAALLMLLFLLAAALGGPEAGADTNVARFIAEIRPHAPRMVQAAAAITMLGSAAFTLPLAAIAALFLLWRRRVAAAAILIISVLGVRLLTDSLKGIVARPRPPGGEMIVDSFAYPSGHAANGMVTFLLVGILAVPAAHRRQAIAGAILLSLLIGITRIVLGVHWASDVAGGWALGLAAAALAMAVAEKSTALHLEPQHEIIGRHGDAAGKDEAA